MAAQDPYHLELGSDLFLFLCTKLNATVQGEDPVWSVDIFSGGFKYSDEIPDDLNESPELFLPLITLLRCLWAYRISLVEGKTRLDLAPTWESTRSLAPQWVGFTPDRCSATMQPILDEVRSRKLQFDRDIERLEARIRTPGDIVITGAENGDLANVDSYPIDTK